MSRRLDWSREGRNWPNREASRFVDAAGIHWHVQQMGGGPAVLLLHGTGASSHSWRDVMPALADDFCVIAPDLPGHAFTRSSHVHMPLPSMAKALWGLLDALGTSPALIAGHSAGAAIALQMLNERETGTPVVGFSPALAPFPGLGAQAFPLMAKLLFVNPLVPRLFSGFVRLSGETERFLERSTSSRIDAVGLRCYEKLLTNSAHCKGALAMMANWNLEEFDRRLPDIANRALLVHSQKDPAVPVASVRKAADRLEEVQPIAKRDERVPCVRVKIEMVILRHDGEALELVVPFVFFYQKNRLENGGGCGDWCEPSQVHFADQFSAHGMFGQFHQGQATSGWFSLEAVRRKCRKTSFFHVQRRLETSSAGPLRASAKTSPFLLAVRLTLSSP